jgi:conjugative relaxase-like TrwC/TraI family protein
MTMSLHKLTAGTGYTYLTRQVAAADRTGGARTPLATYYTERGETPGQWVGSGVAGIEGLTVGDEVTAPQMQALFGSGLHPLAQQRRERLEGPDLTDADYRAVTRLGMPYKVYDADVTAFQVEVAKRIEDHAASLGHPRDYPVPSQDRARIRTQVALEFFRDEHHRDPVDARELAGTIAKHSRPRTTAVGGYDLTFSPVKSVSALWAVAPPDIAAQVELAHHDAVADALGFIEAHALYTREGANGVRQVDVTGLVATAFTHRDSRAGDPDLHTHVAVANKVQTLTGKWLSVDGRILFKANVAASETYNTSLEKHLRTRLGLVFGEREGTDRGKRPVREVVEVDPRLNARWSTRRVAIEARRAVLAAAFQADHGRPPTVVESIQLAQQATLETREAKHEPRTLTEQRQAWAEQAEEVLSGPQGVTAMVTAALTAGRLAGLVTSDSVTVDAAWVRTTAVQVRDEVQARRATWQLWHLRAEAHRQVRAANLPAAQVETVVDLVTHEAATVASVRLTHTSDGIDEPQELRRTDGSSVYEVAGSALFTSTQILTAEARLLATAGKADRHPASHESVAVTLLEQAANGVTLNAGQAALVTGMATSGARLQLAIAPAGAGKTTAMRALTAAWVEDGGTVLGLAPVRRRRHRPA